MAAQDIEERWQETERFIRAGYFDVVVPGRKALRPPTETSVFHIPSNADKSRPARVVGKDQWGTVIAYTTLGGAPERGHFRPLDRDQRTVRPEWCWVDMERGDLWVAQVLTPSSDRPFDWHEHYLHGDPRGEAPWARRSALERLASFLRGGRAGSASE